ncbi:MAG: homocysteine S-methyltransferase family protein [Candidatus Hydrogenedentes bacterium]|nr:homocysteine S-methyltransferase family protein [Candidatus Hydrogenedentota bacterium]
MDFLTALRQQVIVIDGAMGTQVQNLGLGDADYGGVEFKMLPDILVFSHPDAIRDIHLAYFRAGSNAVETNTFGATPFRLAEYDFSRLELGAFDPIPYGIDLRRLSYEEFAYYASRRAAEIACDARAAYRKEPGYDGRPLFVLGSIGPSNRVLSSTDANLKLSTFDEMADNFYHQTRGLLEGGADVLLYETQQDILELKAAVFGGRKAMRESGKKAAIMAQVTVDQFSKMQIFNTDIHAALVTMQGVGIDTFGINCSIGPDLMVKTVEKLARYSPLPISVIPNAGLPVSENGRTVFKFKPDKFSEYLETFTKEYGVNIVGGCCGTTPDHIAAVTERLRGRKPAARTPENGLYISGPQEAVLLDSSETLIMVGERLNVRGSKKVREAVENEGIIDQHALEEVVEEQVRGLGVKVIDVCMDSNVVDTTETLKQVVHKQTTDFSGAMCIDSFAVDALEAAIKVYPGRPIINSMSMEEVAPGVTKVDAVLNATKDHWPMYVGLAAGPKGPGATREEKAELARQIVENAAKHGVTPGQIFIDMNVFPVGSESEEGMNFAVESLEAIPLIKAIHPDLRTICGVGNLTNGLAKKPYMRQVLTSVWLDEARKRGLDAAIINPNHYVFVKDLDPGDYALGLKVILERDMEAFEQLEDIAEKKKGFDVVRRTSYEDLPLEEAICEKIKDGFKEREHGDIEVGGHHYKYADRIVRQVAEAIKTHEPLPFINTHLMRAMNELGDGFARGEVSLPHLLKSADVMKQVMGFLEEYMRVSAGIDVHAKIEYKGVIVIGTVYQDVHSIGKDLAKTLFENYGYRVIDLGVMTPLQTYLDAAKEHRADAIGMSALLVQTSNHMITVSKMMREQGLEHVPVLIGGAPVNDRHAAYVAMAGETSEDRMRSNVFYCATAMDGVNVMNALKSAAGETPLLAENLKKLHRNFERAEKKAQEEETLLRTLPRRVVSFDGYRLPESPYVPARTESFDLREFKSRLDRKTLFALNWKFGGTASRAKQGESDEKLNALLDRWVESASTEGWVRPLGIWGIFPCQSDGDEVIVYDLEDMDREIGRLGFSVVIGGERKDTVCAAQYFHSKSSGVLDAIGLQISTSGPQVDAQLKRFREAGDSESILYLQGLSDRVAEDMADCLHGIQRKVLGFDAKHGIRWSPGYPAMAEARYNQTILELLHATELIGVKITDAGEFSPTGTTAAAVCFHPGARYT